MNSLSELLSKIENASPTQRDKGTTFENLCVQYFLNEPKYAELYSSVLSYSAWIEKYGNSIGITHKKDSGIDLISVTKTGEFHAVRCKNYNQTKIAKKDIDSFLAASDKNILLFDILWHLQITGKKKLKICLGIILSL